MIFLDAERPAYAGYWPQLARVLRPGGLPAVDNVLSHADEVGDFCALIRADERVSEAVVPTGAGLLRSSGIRSEARAVGSGPSTLTIGADLRAVAAHRHLTPHA